jgi:hypothetical protein
MEFSLDVTVQSMHIMESTGSEQIKVVRTTAPALPDDVIRDIIWRRAAPYNFDDLVYWWPWWCYWDLPPEPIVERLIARLSAVTGSDITNIWMPLTNGMTINGCYCQSAWYNVDKQWRRLARELEADYRVFEQIVVCLLGSFLAYADSRAEVFHQATRRLQREREAYGALETALYISGRLSQLENVDWSPGMRGWLGKVGKDLHQVPYSRLVVTDELAEEVRESWRWSESNNKGFNYPF